ncbi:MULTISPECIES: monovalent cation/H+ antiporter complex subunit F [Jiangella]|uniref:Multisubunit sodium/proton antiporter, MrpF subunit n=1 Tax=Jiangella alkaliphila TaxID=419479 RepID=A0A1H2KPH8_9ACTN|nr:MULTISPECIES: monovalent cation/H+ antiporter complex subunit F [Jiangella]SDU70216.1 multisubunit sodium/proton antiporter, MrpF subunit [Jiangella alkaliphila]
MTVVIWVCAAMLSVAAVLVLTRMAVGPTMLNRVVAMDVLIAIVVAGLGLEAALNRHATTLPILVVLSLVGFVGSVSVARFAAHDDKGEGS